MSDDDRLVAGRYRLIARLGSGGMGVVWQAYDERLHRTVAVKKLLMPAELTGPQTEEAKRLAMREGRITAKLTHPNSVMVYDVADDGGQPYLIMEYLPSKSLSAVLAERGPMPPVEVAEIGHKVAAALASAHAAGVVHRDVKPGNILLGHDGAVKITDFGISRAVEDVTGNTTGIIAGTPAYLAPEVAKGGRATFSSDVFSLGATLYTAIEGVPPFGSGDNAMALLYKVASGDVRPPTQAGPMTEVLMRLLRADPNQRPTMAQASAELATVATVATREPVAAGPTAQFTPRMDQRAGAAAAAAGAAAGVAAGNRVTPTRLDPSGPTPEPKAPAVPSAYPARRPPAARRNRRRPAALAALALAIAALATVAILQLLDDDVPVDGTAAPPSATSAGVPPGTLPNPTTPPAQSTTAAPTTTTAPPAAPPAEPPQNAPPQNPPPQNPPPQNVTQTASAALVSYYALMPGNLQEGWTRLTPKYQRYPAGGYSGYQNFWNQMRSVQVSNVVARQSNVVEATVQYNFKTGKVVRERHSYTLVNQGGRWLIDESRVLSSVTL